MQPTISVIVPTCNKAHLLERFLIRLSKQKFPLGEIELIVIDDWSEDWTDKLLRHWSSRLNLIVVRPLYRDPQTRRSFEDISYLGDRLSRANFTFLFHPEMMIGDNILQALYTLGNGDSNEILKFCMLTPDEQIHLDEVDWEDDLMNVEQLGCKPERSDGLCLWQNTDRETLDNPYFKPILKEQAIA